MKTIDVTGQGAVLLGADIACDGFYQEAEYRIQSHIHEDHLVGFDESKGFQQILMTEPSYDLLVSQKNADLKYRSNIKPIKPGKVYSIGTSKLRVLHSGHMLGAVQIEVKLKNGLRVGYSGDFDWPLKDVIKVDRLVVDSTYGSPKKRLSYTPQEAHERLVELIHKRLAYGPVTLTALRGTLQHTLDIISNSITCPLVASPQTYKDVQIYRKYGYSIHSLFDGATKEGKRITKDNKKHIQIVRTFERNPALICMQDCPTIITISAYMSNPADPIVQTGDNTFTVSLTRHASFEGTIEYIRKTGAKEVITDAFRCGHAWDLAQEVQTRLGIKAQASANKVSREWGK